MVLNWTNLVKIFIPVVIHDETEGSTTQQENFRFTQLNTKLVSFSFRRNSHSWIKNALNIEIKKYKSALCCKKN
jgi:hypothetical protein